MRGVLFLCVTTGVILLLLSRSSLLSGDLGLEVLAGDPALAGERLASWMRLGLLGACLLTILTASGPAIYFSPSELNLLLTGPFTRRGLILYKFSFYVAGAFLSALIITLIAQPLVGTGLSILVGSFLALMFLQLLSAVIELSSQAVASPMLTRMGRAVMVLIAIYALASVFWLATHHGLTVTEILSAFESSWFGRIVLAPFDVFVSAFLSREVFPDLLGWTAVAAAIDGGLLALIVLLDRRTYETSIAASEALDRRWVRALRGGHFWAIRQTAARTLPRPPTLSGLGLMAWRQSLNVMRTSVKPIAVLLVLAVLMGPLLVEVGKDISPWSRIGVLFFIGVFVIPRTLVFDFRSDLDNLEHFKSLPLSPWAICAGQLVIAVLLTSVIELALIASALPFLQGSVRNLALVLALFALPFNLLMYALENTFFLMFPSRLVPVGRVDFDFFGRTLIELTVKSFFLFVGCALAAGIGIIVFRATNGSWIAFTMMAWVSLALLGGLNVVLLGWAFRRFDVSRM